VGNLSGEPAVLARIDRESIRPPASSGRADTPPAEDNARRNAESDAAWLKQADHLYKLGHYEELETLAKERLRNEPDSVAALTYRAAVLNSDNQTDMIISPRGSKVDCPRSGGRIAPRGNGHTRRCVPDCC